MAALTWAISLGGFRVFPPVLVGGIGMAVAPFLLAVPADLALLGIGVKLAAVIMGDEHADLHLLSRQAGSTLCWS